MAGVAEQQGETRRQAGQRRVAQIQPATGLLRGLSVRELWAYRDVCLALARRRLKAKYKQTALGVAWVVVQPLATVVVFTFVFGELAGLPSDGIPYVAFVFCALVLWGYFGSVLHHGAQSLVEDRELVTKVYFPRLLAPLAAALPPLIDLAVGLAVLAVVLAVTGVVPDLAVLTAPLWLVLLVVLAAGVASLLAALNVLWRDVGHATTFAVQLWLFLSPVIFPSSEVEGAARTLLALNPMTGIIDGWRWAVAGAPPPPAVDLLSLATGTAVVVVGVVVFQRVERRLADVV